LVSIGIELMPAKNIKCAARKEHAINAIFDLRILVSDSKSLFPCQRSRRMKAEMVLGKPKIHIFSGFKQFIEAVYKFKSLFSGDNVAAVNVVLRLHSQGGKPVVLDPAWG